MKSYFEGRSTLSRSSRLPEEGGKPFASLHKEHEKQTGPASSPSETNITQDAPPATSAPELTEPHAAPVAHDPPGPAVLYDDPSDPDAPKVEIISRADSIRTLIITCKCGKQLEIACDF